MTYKLYDYLNDLNYNKTHILRSDSSAVAGFSPYITNIAMSLHTSSVFDANDMNKHHTLNKSMQYDYYFHVLNKQKRFAKWPKKQKADNNSIIKEYYKVNTARALEYESILSSGAIAYIKSKLNRGGRL